MKLDISSVIRLPILTIPTVPFRLPFHGLADYTSGMKHRIAKAKTSRYDLGRVLGHPD